MLGDIPGPASPTVCGSLGARPDLKAEAAGEITQAHARS